MCLRCVRACTRGEPALEWLLPPRPTLPTHYIHDTKDVECLDVRKWLFRMDRIRPPTPCMCVWIVNRTLCRRKYRPSTLCRSNVHAIREPQSRVLRRGHVAYGQSNGQSWLGLEYRHWASWLLNRQHRSMACIRVWALCYAVPYDACLDRMKPNSYSNLNGNCQGSGRGRQNMWHEGGDRHPTHAHRILLVLPPTLSVLAVGVCEGLR